MKPRATVRHAILLLLALETAAPAKPPLQIGVDANYALDMERGGAAWSWDGTKDDLFRGIAAQGVGAFRVRLWMKDDGPHGKTYATEVVRRALDAGLDPYLVIFLSEDWSDMMKQPLPSAWKDLSFDERAGAVQAYSRGIVAHFRAQGLQSHLYEIGNEIDYGLCGEYPGQGTKKTPAALSRSLWPRSARLILAGQAGVREANPDARFMLHIAHWWDAEFCVAFFRFMLDQGVQIDFAGLSYFPSANIGGSLEMSEFGETVARLSEAVGRPVIVAETAYPSTRDFKGQFSRWKYETPGYPLSPEGQRRWLADFLAFCNRHPAIRAVYYWSPEWCGEGMWKAFALFDPAGEAKPAWTSFPRAAWEERSPNEPVYLEACSNELFVVPVREAKEAMVPLVRRLRGQTGGVSVEHIALLTNTVLNVGAYRVDLKASLQNNMHLSRRPESAGLPLDPGALETLAGGLDPKTQKVIVFLRGHSTPGAEAVIAFLEARGFEVCRHPKEDGAPLKFGMGGKFDP